jgi:disulfide bond formation protein DsbB
MLRVLAIIALAASLLAAGPAAAHVGGGERAVLQASPRPAPAEPLGLESVLRSDGRPDAAWPIALVALLAAACLAQHRSRRLVMSVLVVLVAVSGVEAAVHSVHHASDGNPVACPTASFAAHVDGTTAAALALDVPVYLVGAVAAPSGPRPASLRSLDPSQPRAPPAPLV